MAAGLVSCTKNPAGGAGGGTDGTFLVDDATSCEPVQLSGGNIPKGLEKKVLAGVLTDSSYSSSAFLAVDLGAGKVCPVARGESGDAWLVDGPGGLVAFSRRAPELNYTVFTSYGRTSQQATPLAANGDPHDLVVFDDGSSSRWLLAMNTAGKLVDFDPSRPAERTSLVPRELERGASGVAVFRPADILVVRGDELAPEVLESSGGNPSDEFVLALHQGLDQYYRGNGSQAIYAWRRTGAGTYVEADLNPARSGINGWPLRLSNPSGFFRSGDSVALAGLCFSVDTACNRGVERFKLSDVGSSKETTLVTDFGGQAIYSNGSVVHGVIDNGKDAVKEFAFAATQQAAGKKITAIDLENGKIHTVHSFTGSSTGYYGLWFDQQSGTLVVGDSDGSRGMVWLYPLGDGGKPTTSPARMVIGSKGQAFPMQFLLLNRK
jgi:streptogramin lyase